MCNGSVGIGEVIVIVLLLALFTLLMLLLLLLLAFLLLPSVSEADLNCFNRLEGVVVNILLSKPFVT